MTARSKRRDREMAERFWSKVDVGLCWEWTAGCNKSGYGSFRLNGRGRLAHRVAWELLVGPIGPSLTLDHLCRNRRCVNPDHLEPVPHLTNVRRGVNVNRVKSHCPRGHPYSGSNLYIHPSGQRVCRSCASDSKRAWRFRKETA